MLFGVSRITHSNLKVELEDLKKENRRLKHTNDFYEHTLRIEMNAASFSVDWKAMNAFSIERNWYDGALRTIIGYMLQEPAIHTEGEDSKITYKDVVREWYLHCSAEEHERLVKEFNEYVAKKSKK